MSYEILDRDGRPTAIYSLSIIRARPKVLKHVVVDLSRSNPIVVGCHSAFCNAQHQRYRMLAEGKEALVLKYIERQP